jgi:hypothetical protein
MMHLDITTITYRYMLIFQFITVSILVSFLPVTQLELLKIWKKLYAPLHRRKTAQTNHKSNKFWEMDMTKLEP